MHGDVEVAGRTAARAGGAALGEADRWASSQRGSPGAERGAQFLPPLVAVFVFGVGAGAEGEDLVVDAVLLRSISR
ncbi:hypothetical protein [Streptomyces sp. NPDC088180]|uniref:hypothetical protein n=1 Tax=Streptomyces sp. NPDC088180 TaxID=3365837 RepID=UPI003827BC9E